MNQSSQPEAAERVVYVVDGEFRTRRPPTWQGPVLRCYCGDRFQARNHRQVFCSDRCRWRAVKWRKRAA